MASPPHPPYLLIVDLEATCDDRRVVGDGNGQVPRHEMEIIEIGAVLVDGETYAVLGDVAVFVKPVRHPVLTEFCKRLTGITQEDVDGPGAVSFKEAVDRVTALTALTALTAEHVLFCSWGDYDKKQLAQDASFHRIPHIPWASRHVNLKRLFKDARADVAGGGIDDALANVGLTFEGTLHRGIDDARNVVRLLPWIWPL